MSYSSNENEFISSLLKANKDKPFSKSEFFADSWFAKAALGQNLQSQSAPPVAKSSDLTPGLTPASYAGDPQQASAAIVRGQTAQAQKNKGGAFGNTQQITSAKPNKNNAGLAPGLSSKDDTAAV